MAETARAPEPTDSAEPGEHASALDQSDALFHAVRILQPAHIPPAQQRILDLALLDMNYGWPNLGHDSIVRSLAELTHELEPLLTAARLKVRVLSYDVRAGAVLPEPPGGRFQVYVGSGGPGHLDPRNNNGIAPGSQGVAEDPSWEAPAFALFDAIAADPEAALVGICHSYGVMCRWAGIAHARFRTEAQGGKSTGVLENLLTDEALRHPWFGRFSAELPDRRRMRILDTRYFDLVPENGRLPPGMTALAHETRGLGGPAGEALTMVEFARDRGGEMPRLLGMNHHPEIGERARQIDILEHKLRAGEVTQAWHDERTELMTRSYPQEDSDQLLRLTSEYTFLGPVRFHLQRLAEQRAAALCVARDL